MAFPYLPINVDPSSTNARIKYVEQQLVESGEMNTDLRDQYLDIFHNRRAGAPVEIELTRLEDEIRHRSRAARAEVMQYVHQLYNALGTNNVDLTQYLAIFPDTVDANGLPVWDFALLNPLRWADLNSEPPNLTQYNRWIPPTQWLAQPPTNFNVAAAPFVPIGQDVVVPNPQAVAPVFQVFRPSHVLLNQPPRLLPAQFIERARRMGIYINPRYEGGIDRFTLTNASCPEVQNCSLFITNVPANSDDAEFFNQIYEGAIFSYHKKLPVGEITTCAISLVFTTREGAVAFHTRCATEGFWIRNQPVRVTWNRERVWPVGPDAAHQTRVLRIIGPINQVNFDALLHYLGSVVNFVETHRRGWVDGQGQQVFEIGFSSIRGQARNSMKALATYLGYQWRVMYAPDPCDQRR